MTSIAASLSPSLQYLGLGTSWSSRNKSCSTLALKKQTSCKESTRICTEENINIDVHPTISRTQDVLPDKIMKKGESNSIVVKVFHETDPEKPAADIIYALANGGNCWYQRLLFNE
ncbi:hypothetical protein AC579_533 [Pseudocercospora musae]|uniref:Uncharacterized protein n=1 Tax=Pseudocercospora musae TaxID=113226 RepID=A0A139IRV3_9PEZI|nr:hypothetical protein AC579_533 [Pseudocercospora musae]